MSGCCLQVAIFSNTGHLANTLSSRQSHIVQIAIPENIIPTKRHGSLCCCGGEHTHIRNRPLRRVDQAQRIATSIQQRAAINSWVKTACKATRALEGITELVCVPRDKGDNLRNDVVCVPICPIFKANVRPKKNTRMTDSLALPSNIGGPLHQNCRRS